METHGKKSRARPGPGVTYAGRGRLDSAVRAVEAASKRAGMRCERQAPVAGTLRLAAVQEGPWYKTLILALPQRVEWEIRQDGDRLSVYAELRAFGWHVALLLILFLYVVLSILSAFLATGEDSPLGWDWPPLVVARFLLPALVLAFVIVRLLGALGGGRQAEALWPAVVAGVEEDGGFLEPAGRTVSLPFAVAILGYAGVFLAIGVWLVWSNSSHPSATEGITLFLAALVAAAFVLIAGAGWMVARRGFIVRTIPILAGVSTAVSGLMFLGLQLPWWLVSRMEDAARLEPSQTACRLAVGITPFIAFLAASLASYGIYLSIFSWPQLLRIHRHREKGVYRQAVSGGFLLWLFRGIFVTSWIFFSGFILAALGLAVLNALQSLVPIFNDHQLRLAELSASMSAVALGRPAGDPWLGVVARVGWIAYGLAGSILLAVSTGQLFLAQRVGRRAMRAAAGSPAQPRQRELQETLDAWCRDQGHGRVSAVVTAGSSLSSAATVFGLWPAERFIEISSDCLDVLDDDELAALVAHELAHHLEGHCRRDQLLRWLGRLTLVGDGFVLALQDSWGYERRADLAAVEKVGISGKILGRSLVKLRHARAAAHLAGAERGTAARPLGFPALPEPSRDQEESEPDDLARLLDGGPSALGLKERWRLAWKLFRRQYFRAMDLHYWHPGMKERTRALLASGAGDRTRGGGSM